MHPRIRRLQADYNKIMTLYNGQHPNIKVIVTEGTPPEKYTIQFYIKGLKEDLDQSVKSAEIHKAEIFLSVDYPRRAPFCRMITPVFHPNIDSQKICIGDHWSAGEALDQLITRIAEIISFQSYNVKSPLNAIAAAWTENNIKNLPLDNTDFTKWL